MTVVRPEARAAAAWWASRLGNCHHDTIGLNAPNPRLTLAGMDDVIAYNLEPQGRYDDDTRDLFAQHLEAGIDERLADAEAKGDAVVESGVSRSRRVFSVDYGCDDRMAPVLARAAEAAGIELGLYDLPFKTWMRVDPGKVTVSEGYGAPAQVVWHG